MFWGRGKSEESYWEKIRYFPQIRLDFHLLMKCIPLLTKPVKLKRCFLFLKAHLSILFHRKRKVHTNRQNKKAGYKSSELHASPRTQEGISQPQLSKATRHLDSLIAFATDRKWMEELNLNRLSQVPNHIASWWLDVEYVEDEVFWSQVRLLPFQARETKLRFCSAFDS